MRTLLNLSARRNFSNSSERERRAFDEFLRRVKLSRDPISSWRTITWAQLRLRAASRLVAAGMPEQAVWDAAADVDVVPLDLVAG